MGPSPNAFHFALTAFTTKCYNAWPSREWHLEFIDTALLPAESQHRWRKDHINLWAIIVRPIRMLSYTKGQMRIDTRAWPHCLWFDNACRQCWTILVANYKKIIFNCPRMRPKYVFISHAFSPQSPTHRVHLQGINKLKWTVYKLLWHRLIASCPLFWFLT